MNGRRKESATGFTTGASRAVLVLGWIALAAVLLTRAWDPALDPFTGFVLIPGALIAAAGGAIALDAVLGAHRAAAHRVTTGGRRQPIRTRRSRADALARARAACRLRLALGCAPRPF